jgi:hypothetical protein
MCQYLVVKYMKHRKYVPEFRSREHDEKSEIYVSI